jgi:hypothetical protein
VNWVKIGLALIIFVTSALLAHVITKRLQKRRTAYPVAFILFILGLSILSRQFLLPAINSWKYQRDLDRSLLDISAYQQIAKYDMQAYQEIRAEILDSTKKGENPTQAIGRGRKKIGALVTRYIPHASDEAIVRYMIAMIQEIEELANKDPDLCYQFLFPDRYGSPDSTKYFKPDTQRADLNALADVIRTAAEQPQPEPDKTQGEALLKKVMSSFYEAHGEEAQLLRDPFAPGIDKGKVCNLIAELYREALKLPQKDRGLLLRYMLSAKKSS